MSLCLVTGGAGFIGSSLARALLARGDQVRVIDNFSSGKRENLADIADGVELVEGDILDDRALARAVEGVELVFHEAAIPSVPKSMAEPLENHAANATGTLRVLEQARRAGIRRLVYAASSAAYGDDPFRHGFAPNRQAMEDFLRYAQEQNYISRRMTAEELFVPETRVL